MATIQSGLQWWYPNIHREHKLANEIIVATTQWWYRNIHREHKLANEITVATTQSDLQWWCRNIHREHKLANEIIVATTQSDLQWWYRNIHREHRSVNKTQKSNQFTAPLCAKLTGQEYEQTAASEGKPCSVHVHTVQALGRPQHKLPNQTLTSSAFQQVTRGSF